ncbi:MAG: flagellar biosynthesis protein FlhB [Bacillaceae bacterium]|jgi:flagellar biosynthetic protein FlhB|uniref:Flagellar biosynthetic protein FlhB n=2 Tax=Aeribacillus TaxID=1055323 RepID=A0A162C9F2_9BACI|nr:MULTISPECIES: flagellar biosynthesis protein FlhB [Aeribacillus]AXI39826.1 flagellar biosynthesis protein FlhB [Bacillaceae bacterium ZC4]REJ19517.1 MAG: flagellar biosynthesis protein FlhB [Bacillaceae bacterium]ASS91544.1 flagellar biosynthesis protein FlhB [Aeribacillus pallidus]KZM57962.1 flagellar biosynthesis protein FlhB [Aeribacillus pallidus]KZN97613.1 flagellar biosynthesis protein FlhB [Aeribacillus pallidus]
MNYLPLDLQYFAGEKTEKATPRKRQDVRKKGQVAKSPDLNTAITMFLVFLSLLFFGKTVIDNILNMFHSTFEDYLLTDITEENVHSIFNKYVLEGAQITAPFMIAAFVAGVFSNYIQVGFLFTTEPLKMKLNKLNPIEGFKRIYSIRAIVELLKSILKVFFIGGVTFAYIYFNWQEILRLPQMPLERAFASISKLAVQIGLYASGALLFIALLDYLYQRWDFEKNIRMSKQEVKDEYKKMEGDPLIRSRIKQKQREMAMRRMMQEIPKADVVITNPTHYAVALKYDEKEHDAPVVVAKGTDFVAQKIKQIAKAHEIITVENRQLARSLYDQVEIGEMIPEQFFKAVAEILAYVYRQKQKV